MPKISFITGGQRSGKSQFAENLALSLSDNPIYMATSRLWDAEYRARIHAHQARRGSGWTNIEEEKHLSQHDVSGRVVLVDCVSLWATNYFYDEGSELALPALQQEFDALVAKPAHFIFVSNEIGLGGIPMQDVQRQFTDLLGSLNQYIAARADEVYFVVSGIPMKIKEQR
jgi:adenosylcobinamide kinase/adenosylcobinamide-phosphate guanylyltransferase